MPIIEYKVLPEVKRVLDIVQFAIEMVRTEYTPFGAPNQRLEREDEADRKGRWLAYSQAFHYLQDPSGPHHRGGEGFTQLRRVAAAVKLTGMGNCQDVAAVTYCLLRDMLSSEYRISFCANSQFKHHYILITHERSPSFPAILADAWTTELSACLYFHSLWSRGNEENVNDRNCTLNIDNSKKGLDRVRPIDPYTYYTQSEMNYIAGLMAHAGRQVANEKAERVERDARYARIMSGEEQPTPDELATGEATPPVAQIPRDVQGTYFTNPVVWDVRNSELQEYKYVASNKVPSGMMTETYDVCRPIWYRDRRAIIEIQNPAMAIPPTTLKLAEQAPSPVAYARFPRIRPAHHVRTDFNSTKISRDRWTPDAVGKCEGCGGDTRFMQRHHCRICGALLCSSCAMKKWTIVPPASYWICKGRHKKRPKTLSDRWD